ncbi:MAG: VWA domain-containing protein [Planctomycetes bacterium]|nr:VWA domain-containing protein [Planctomycetota bacterium]
MSATAFLARPEWWPALLAGPAVWFVLRARDAARARTLARVAGPRGDAVAPGRSDTLRRVRQALFAEGMILAAIAAMHPVWGGAYEGVERRSADVVVCLDVSRSMLARDVAPNRLERARREIRALAERARGDRLALVVFAGEARIAVPLTLDRASFAEMAERADTLSVRRGGTDLGGALGAALRAISQAGSEHAAVILLTDGEDLGGRGLAAAADCRDHGVAVHCVGLGSPLGSKIAVADGPGDGSVRPGETFLRDASGADVVSAMDAESLRRIAYATGGSFTNAGTDATAGATAGDDVLTTLYDDRVLPMARQAFASAEREHGDERGVNRYQVPLLGAFLLFILDLCLTDRSRA